jgi:putative membrane protein
MIAFLIHCLMYGLSFMLAAKIVPGLRVRSFGSAVMFSVVFAILDGLLFKALAFVTLPLVLLSLGLFLLVIRAGLFLLADKFVDGVDIDGFLPALGGSIVTGIINFLITKLLPFT